MNHGRRETKRFSVTATGEAETGWSGDPMDGVAAGDDSGIGVVVTITLSNK